MTESALADRKQFLVSCHDCSFERPVQGRARALDQAAVHRRGTGHTLLALEMPRTNAPPDDRIAGPN